MKVSVGAKELTPGMKYYADGSRLPLIVESIEKAISMWDMHKNRTYDEVNEVLIIRFRGNPQNYTLPATYQADIEVEPVIAQDSVNKVLGG